MTTPERARADSPAEPDPTNAGAPVALIILAISCGAGALVLTVFGVWPGAVLILAAAGLAALAERRLRKVPPA